MGEITDFFKGTQNTLRSFFTKLEEWDRMTSASLTGYISKVSVDGTVYMEQNIVEDDIAIPLMGCLNQMYVCWILCALGLDARCNDGRTVNERMRIVHGVQMLEDDFLSKIKDGFGMGTKIEKIGASMEDNKGPLADVESQVSRLATGRLVEFDFNTGQNAVTETSHYGDSTSGMTRTDTEKTKSDANTRSDGIAIKKDEQYSRSGQTTKQHDSSFDRRSVQPGSCKAYFYVTLHPFQINKEVYNNFMQLNFVPTMSTRWRAVRAKEIAFWKDFIFARDLVERQAKMLKNDKSGLVTQMMARQNSGVWRWIGGMLDLIPKSHNLSNAILVFDKQTFDHSCREAHIDFNNVYQRMQFFRKTFTMMTVVVDTMYGKVDMYYAGVPQVGNYTFNMINKVGAGKNDNFDLKSIMTAFSSGNSPRF